MAPVGLSAYALAKALSVPLPRVNDIVREKRSISPEMAVLLSAYFGTSDGYWINLQGHFDLEMAKDKVGKQAALISPHPHRADGRLQPIGEPRLTLAQRLAAFDPEIHGGEVMVAREGSR